MDVFDNIMPTILRAEHLGSRKLDGGVRLIGNVTHVAPQAYLHVVFPPLDAQQIDSMEENIGRRLPTELRVFYGRSNGIFLFAYSLSIFGVRHSFVRRGDEAWQPHSIVTPNVRERPKDASESIVFFGFYEHDGSTLGMSAESPIVYRFAPRSAQPLNEWPSFNEMLLSEVRRLATLFDDFGRKINEDVVTTPD